MCSASNRPRPRLFHMQTMSTVHLLHSLDAKWLRAVSEATMYLSSHKICRRWHTGNEIVFRSQQLMHVSCLADANGGLHKELHEKSAAKLLDIPVLEGKITLIYHVHQVPQNGEREDSARRPIPAAVTCQN